MIVSSLVLICTLLGSTTAWHQTIEFDFQVDFKEHVRTSDLKWFESEYAGRDNFVLLSNHKSNLFSIENATDKPSFLIGARNHLYRLSVPDLKVIKDIKWMSASNDVSNCLNRSVVVNKDECDNFIKLFTGIDQHSFKVCSTNALNPKCRHIQLIQSGQEVHSLSKNEFHIVNETSGIGYAPIRAYDNKYLYYYAEQTRTLYTGNSLDLNRRFTSINRFGDQNTMISTNLDDNNWLHEADFVTSFVHDSRIFFLINEYASIDASNPANINMAPRRISRIVHLCLNDQGAPLSSLRIVWTTFMKTKLSCAYNPNSYKSRAHRSPSRSEEFSTPPRFEESEALFYFDELKSTSELFTDKNGKSYFYAVFSTVSNKITASAVCMFTMDQIMNSFHGAYQGVAATAVPNPRPSSCPNELTYQHVVFSRKKFVMENEIVSEAIVAETTSKSRFNSIDVDYKVESILGDSASTDTETDVLFVGTDDGKILTFVVQSANSSLQKSLRYSEELIIFDDKEKNVANEKKKMSQIKNIKLYKSSATEKSYFIIMTESKVLTVPHEYCSLKLEKHVCDSHAYPYCAWSTVHGKCFNSQDFKNAQTANKQLDLNNHTTGMYSSMRKITVVEGDGGASQATKLASALVVADGGKNTNRNMLYQLDDNKIVFSMSFNSFFLLFILVSVLFSLVLIMLVRVLVRKTISLSEMKDREVTANVDGQTRLSKVKSVAWKYLTMMKSTRLCSLMLDVGKTKQANSDRSDSTERYFDQTETRISSISSTSPTTSSSSSSSLTKLSSISTLNTQQIQSRYAFVNSNKNVIPSHLISGSNTLRSASSKNDCNKSVVNDSKFKDYDSAEYFLLKKSLNNSCNYSHLALPQPQPPHFQSAHSNYFVDANNSKKFYL